MEFLSRFFIRNYKLTIVLSLFVMTLGLIGLKKMNAESYPAVDFAAATITTYYRGASPDDIEALITKPIEDEIRTVSGLKDVKSISQTGQSTINVRIDMDNVDEKSVMDDVQKAVQRVSTLPVDLPERPKFLEIKSEEFPAIEIAISGSNQNRQRDVIADQLKEDLEDISSVKDVRPVGNRDREFTVALDLKKLDQLHIGVTEVLQKIQLRNVNIPGGDIESTDLKYLVRVEGKIHTEEELKELVIRSNFQGQILKLKDIADVIDGGVQKTQTLAAYNGEPATLLIVNKKAGTDTIKLADAVFEIVKRYQKKHDGEFKFNVYNNEAVKVRNKLSILSSNAISGLVLVIFFLLIFLPGRVGIMASLSLPLAVFGTLGIMPFFGMNLDSITILALIIALGMLVDNAIVVTDDFVQKKHEGMTTEEALVKSVTQLWAPITATAFTTIAAFLPMLVTKGVMGEFIKWIPIVVTIALLMSLVESFFLLPMRLYFVGDKIKVDPNANKKDWFSKFALKFEGLMNLVVRRRYTSAVIISGLIIFSLVLMAKGNKFVLFPPEQTEIYMARITTPLGTPQSKTLSVIEKLSADIQLNLKKEYRELVGRAGTSKLGPTDQKGGEGDNQGLISIYVNDETKYNIPHTEVLKKLRSIDTSKYGNVTFEELVNGPPVGAPINATFRSSNAKNLNQVINSILVKLKNIPGIIDLQVDDVVDAENVFVEINYDQADRLGVNVSDIGTTVRTALAGVLVSDVTLNNKKVKINVKFLDQYRQNLEQLKNIKVMDRMGNLIPLSTFATFRQTSGAPHVKRFDYKRAKTILGNVDEKIITSQAANKLVRDEFNLIQSNYPDVTMIFGGQEESTKESMESLGQASILAAIGIFALLVFMFKSFLRPFIIMSTIPLGFIGFSVAFFLHGRPISFMALVGIIGLAGIIVNSGIILIDFIETMKAEGKLTLHEILVKASSMRLRAVVTTSLTTVSGLFPTAYGIGGADAMLIPMTMALAWGLTTGTLLTLVWIPPAYAILEDWSAFTNKLLKRGKA